MTTNHYIGLIIGIPSIIWFGFCTNAETTVALFLCLFANNLSQK